MKGLSLQVITILKKLWMIRWNTRDNTKQQSLLTSILEMLSAKRLLKIWPLKDWRRSRSKCRRPLEIVFDLRRKRLVTHFKKVHTIRRLNVCVRPLDQMTALAPQGLKSARPKPCGVQETRLYHLQSFLKKVLIKISKTDRNIGTWRQP